MDQALVTAHSIFPALSLTPPQTLAIVVQVTILQISTMALEVTMSCLAINVFSIAIVMQELLCACVTLVTPLGMDMPSTTHLAEDAQLALMSISLQ